MKMQIISNIEEAKSLYIFFWGWEQIENTFWVYSSDQIYNNLTNWWLEFLLLLVHTSDWMRNEVSVRPVRTMIGFVKNSPSIWWTTVVSQCRLRNRHCMHFGGGELETFINNQDYCSLFSFILKWIWTLTLNQTNTQANNQTVFYFMGNFRFHFDQVNIIWITPIFGVLNTLVHGQYLTKMTTVVCQCRLRNGLCTHFDGGALETFINVQDHSSSTLYL